MKKIASLITTAAILASGSAYAGGTTSAPMTIKSVEVDGGENGTTNGPYGFVNFTNATGKPACGGTAPGILIGSPEQIKAMTSLATAAFLAGRQVIVLWSGDCTQTYHDAAGNGGSYARIYDVTLQ